MFAEKERIARQDETANERTKGIRKKKIYHFIFYDNDIIYLSSHHKNDQLTTHRWKMKVTKTLTCVLAASAVTLGAVRAEESDGADAKKVFSVPESTGHAFLETFQANPFDKEGQMWIESKDATYEGQKWSHGPRTESSEFYKADTVS